MRSKIAASSFLQARLGLLMLACGNPNECGDGRVDCDPPLPVVSIMVVTTSGGDYCTTGVTGTCWITGVLGAGVIVGVMPAAVLLSSS